MPNRYVPCKPCTPHTHRVLGCSGAGLSGVTAKLKLSGTTIETRTTNGTGRAFFTNHGTFDLEVTDPNGRFATYTSAGFVTTPGGSTTNSMTVASGYHCAGNCAWPLSDTLTITDPFGTHTVTWTTGITWTGTDTVIDCLRGCGGNSFVLGYTFTPSNPPVLVFGFHTTPGPGPLGLCYSTTGTLNTSTATSGTTYSPTYTCFAPSVSAFLAEWIHVTISPFCTSDFTIDVSE